MWPCHQDLFVGCRCRPAMFSSINCLIEGQLATYQGSEEMEEGLEHITGLWVLKVVWLAVLALFYNLCFYYPEPCGTKPRKWPWYGGFCSDALHMFIRTDCAHHIKNTHSTEGDIGQAFCRGIDRSDTCNAISWVLNMISLCLHSVYT